MLSAIQGGKDTERSDSYFGVPTQLCLMPAEINLCLNAICRDVYFHYFNSFLAKRQLLSSADNLCKQCGPRSGPTKCQS